MQTIAGSDPLDQLLTRVGTGIRAQDLSDESLAPYCSELSGQPMRYLPVPQLSIITGRLLTLWPFD